LRRQTVIAARKIEEIDGTGRAHAAVPAETERDVWSWMVAEDPAFYLEERAAR
jgi:hypothetical protein